MMFLLIVTATSVLLAAIMCVIAWRAAADERRRSDARVAALAAAIHDGEPSAGRVQAGRVLSDPPVSRVPVGRVLSDPPPYELFATAPRASAARPAAAFLIGALTIAAIAAVAVVVPRALSRVPRSESTAVTTAPATPPPLELVALGHERVGDQLTVRGVVRNAPSASATEPLTAVVFLFTPDGGFIASGRAAVQTPANQSGNEATFAVTVPGAADVARYRVSFRTDDRIVPHLDRRHEG
jgi:hypothetical protein